MGNLARSFQSRFVIRRASQRTCVKAILADGFYRRMPKPEFPLFSGAGRRLSILFEADGWALEFDDAGDVVAARFVGETLGSLVPFVAGARCVEAGSFVDLWQEYAGGDDDRPNTRWSFDGRGMIWTDLMPRDERAALDEQTAISLAVAQENEARRKDGRPPICVECAQEGIPDREMPLVAHRGAAEGVSKFQCPTHPFCAFLA